MQMPSPTLTPGRQSNASLKKIKLRIMPLHPPQTASVCLLSEEVKNSLKSLKYPIVIPNQS